VKNNTRKTITLPEKVLEVLEADAKRCLRTIPKHIEAILCAYTEAEDVQLKFKSDDILDAEVIQ
jgi:hypothetical protein